MECVVSMTSFGERLKEESIYSIRSILNNSLLPNKICVIVNNFDRDNIPPLYAEHPLIEIIYSELDIKGHNKYYHTALKYPYCIIITIDDDVEYPNTFIEDCIVAYKNNPNVVNACRVHRITYNNERMLPYRQWEWDTNEENESYDLFFTGVGGVVYPPYFFKDNDLNTEVINQFLKVDDILLNYIARKNGYKIKKVFTRMPYKDLNIVKSKHELCVFNVAFNNDLCIKKIGFNNMISSLKRL